MSASFLPQSCVSRWATRACAWSLALAILVGCGGGPNLGTVNGHVTKGGQPQENLWVRFTPKAGGRPSHARTDGNGDFSIHYMAEKGALVGTHEVVIGSGGEVDDRGNLLAPPVELLRQDVEVKGGSNDVNFEIP